MVYYHIPHIYLLLMVLHLEINQFFPVFLLQFLLFLFQKYFAFYYHFFDYSLLQFGLLLQYYLIFFFRLIFFQLLDNFHRYQVHIHLNLFLNQKDYRFLKNYYLLKVLQVFLLFVHIYLIFFYFFHFYHNFFFIFIIIFFIIK